MVHRDELTSFITQTLGIDLLAKAAEIDTMPNGVQIHGADQVNKVALGVSASPECIRLAIDRDAQYLIVHHGLHSEYIVRGRFDLYQNRLKLIFKHNLSLAGYHYTLDAHPTLGNNAVILDRLGAKRLDETYFETWGWIGEFSKPINLTSLIKTAEKLFGHPVYAHAQGTDLIKRLGVCSGGAVPRPAQWFSALIDANVDLHLTGETKESVDAYLSEINKNYLACGHYATETFGVKALGEVIQDHFGTRLKVEFIDVPTDL